MSRWARENPEEMSRISHLPVGEQLDAMRAAVAPLRLSRGRCWGCSHKAHALYACPERPVFTFEDRCGCDRNYGD